MVRRTVDPFSLPWKCEGCETNFRKKEWAEACEVRHSKESPSSNDSATPEGDSEQ